MAVIAAVISLAISVGAIVSSWSRLSASIDEGTHVATGLEWVQHGTYTMWTENPPLARVAVALGPYLGGARLPGPEAFAPTRSPWVISGVLGNALFYRDGAYTRNLAQARAGTLPFFVIVVVFAGLLAARAGGTFAGVITAIALAALPPLVGHASQATTDVAFAATFLLALWAFVRWFDQPTSGRAGAFGFAFALAILTKFTAFVFLPIAIAAVILLQRPRAAATPGPRQRIRGLAPHLLLAGAITALAVWAGYRFSFGDVAGPGFRSKVAWVDVLKPAEQRQGLAALLTKAPLPAPELFNGLLFLQAHNEAGHPAFLLGEQRQHGFRLFYPIALLVKAPLPFLLLLLAGLVLLVRSWREPGARAGLALAAAGVGILLALIPSQLNLGVRHALLVYVLLAAAAAVGTVRAIAVLQPRARTLAAVVLAGVLVAQEGVMLASHPDHIAYFNATAGADPGRILEGADLDWAQGLLELKREALARGVDRLHVAFALGATRACEHGLPPLVALEPHKPVTGWVAVTQRAYSGRREETILRDPCDPMSIRGKQPQLAPGWFRWLHQHQPVWQGSGMRLYYIQPPVGAR